MDLLEFMIELDVSHCLAFNNIMLFTTKITYLISLKRSITYIFSYFFAKINFHSYYPLPIEKRLTLCNVIKHIKSALNKDSW